MVRRPPHILITTPESLYILLTAEQEPEVLATADAPSSSTRSTPSPATSAARTWRSRSSGSTRSAAGKRAAHRPLGDAEADRADRAPAGRRRPRLARDDGTPRLRDRRQPATDARHGARRSRPPTTSSGRSRATSSGRRSTSASSSCVGHAPHHDRLRQHPPPRRARRAPAERAPRRRRAWSRTTAACLASIRLDAEQKLKSGEVPVVVATASLELGIDVGHVDLVCHIGAPRALATLLQRVGRSGHWLGSVPKGIFFPLTRDDLMQTAAAVRAIRAGELDRLHLSDQPLDILAQQMVAIAAAERRRRGRALRARAPAPGPITTSRAARSTRCSRCWPRASRPGADGARRTSTATSSTASVRAGAARGSPPSPAAAPSPTPPTTTSSRSRPRRSVGKVNEDFAIESMRGDIFLLGNHSWRIRRVENGTVRVEDAGQTPPTIPFWTGEAPARTRELSQAVSDLRAEDRARRILDRSAEPSGRSSSPGSSPSAASTPAAPRSSRRTSATRSPSSAPCRPASTVVAERFFDESGGMQLVVHAPFGGAINRAWGLALRKRFCVTFDFELQAAATDDGIVLSLGEQHSFPLANVFHDGAARDPRARPRAGGARRRRCSGRAGAGTRRRALALLRHSGGKRVPMNIQRMRADDLLAAVFPAQAACGDNHTGPIEPPKHPLVDETIANCLYETMDTERPPHVLERIAGGEIHTVAVETPAPSVMAHEILNANPYAFLDDAPLEERRARAVALRRTDPELAAGMGALDAEAIATVRAQAWPDVRDADELHDVLLSLVVLPARRARRLAAAGATSSCCAAAPTMARRGSTTAVTQRALVTAERIAIARAAVPGARRSRPRSFRPPARRRQRRRSAPRVDDRARLARVPSGRRASPISPTASASRAAAVAAALARLEGEGIALQGRFTPRGSRLRLAATNGASGGCWRRIHRLTLGRLRREIDPVSAADFMRFLFRWQHVAAARRACTAATASRGDRAAARLRAPGARRGSAACCRRRVAGFDPGCSTSSRLSGVVAWGRFSPPVGRRRDRRAATRRRRGRRATDPGASPRLTPRRRRTAPTRAAPLALAPAAPSSTLLARHAPDPRASRLVARRPRRRRLPRRRRAPPFTADIAAATGLLPTATEDALWELVARGIVTGDGFAGLRALVAPEDRPRPSSAPARAPRRARAAPRAAGRPLVAARRASATRSTPRRAPRRAARQPARPLRRRAARAARARDPDAALARAAGGAPPPGGARRDPRRALRRRPRRRAVRPARSRSRRCARPRRRDDADVLLIAAADPLNLVGILTPGARISPLSGQVIAFERGVPIDSGDLGAVRHRLRDRSLGRARRVSAVHRRMIPPPSPPRTPSAPTDARRWWREPSPADVCERPRSSCSRCSRTPTPSGTASCGTIPSSWNRKVRFYRGPLDAFRAGRVCP